MTHTLRIGLVGGGFIAHCHVVGYRLMPVVFPEAAAFPALELACDATDSLAEKTARRFGFARSTGDWRRLVEDPAVDVVDICVPSNLHRPIALAAIANGKHLYCEKPVGLSAAEAKEIADAATKAGLKSLVGYTYLRNPLVAYAKRLIEEGRIGRIVHFRGAHNEDYLADPKAPFIWRCDPAIAGAAGALGDLGGHIISLARHLAGDFASVCGVARIVYPERPTAPESGEKRTVGNDDEAQFLIAFANGASGHIETSRIATGSRMDVTYEIVGTEGAIQFDGERMNEIRVALPGAPADTSGFTTVYAGPCHPPYGNFVPAPASSLGFNDQKVVEVYELMQAVAAGAPPLIDLHGACEISRIAEAVLESSKRRAWVEL